MNTGEFNITDLKFEIKAETEKEYLFNNGINDQIISNEVNGKQIQEGCFVSKALKQKQIDIKIENEQGIQFSTDEFNKRHIHQEVYFDSNSIKQEEIHIKSEDEEGNEFSIESSAGLRPTNEATHLSEFFCVNLEDPPVFKCLKCIYQTHKRDCIRRHVLCHRPKTFQCPLCPYKSHSANLLRMHNVIHIPKEEAKLYKCSKCKFTSKRKTGLTQHLIIHKKTDEIKWHQCPECHFKTRYKNYLKKHNWVHRNKCTLCSFEAPSERSLKKHSKVVHKYTDPPLVNFLIQFD